MKVFIVLFLLAGSLININGCAKAQSDYTNHLSSQGGLDGFVQGFVDGYTGTSSFLEASQRREFELGAQKRRSFIWAWVWSGATVLAIFSGKSKRTNS